MSGRSNLSIGSKEPSLLIRLLDRVQIFTGVSRGCFRWNAMEWVLEDEDVWSVELEYRLKRAITFYPTIGSRSNFYMIF
jgi:hypothetical protein